MRPSKTPIGTGNGNIKVEDGEKQASQEREFDGIGSDDQPPTIPSPKLISAVPQSIPISNTLLVPTKEISNDEDATLEITDELPHLLDTTPSLIVEQANLGERKGWLP